VIQLVLPLHKSAIESIFDHAVVESIADPAAAESTAEPLHSVVDSTAGGAAPTETCCLCVQV
jgi:hypothetical protein